jgi:2,5-dioxopentanoate dehydrogenase
LKSRVDGHELSVVWPTHTVAEANGLIDGVSKTFMAYAQTAVEPRAKFLEAIFEEMEADSGSLIERAHHETALPTGRFEGELGRTLGQLRAFAQRLRATDWDRPSHDVALPDRKPMARPDLVRRLVPIGPVAVFGASNFPLAFSTAGGDTASALAAGCPVVVRAHPAHPGTAFLVGEAIKRAAHRCEVPEGVFGQVFGDDLALGATLVTHPQIAGVGFTGSRRGGIALWKMAQERNVPIPFFGEMSSVNPSVVMPDIDAASFAKGLAGSVSMGVGQFCTNPGLVLLIGDASAFLEAYRAELEALKPGTMLTDGIASAYLAGIAAWEANGAEAVFAVKEAGQPGAYTVSAAHFRAKPGLQEEVFGPANLIVRCEDVAEAIRVLESLEGQLTASIWSQGDLPEDLVWALQCRAGRVLLNQFPTGVEVAESMVHGGPWPATTDARFTSVGGLAMERWLRPVCFQGFGA